MSSQENNSIKVTINEAELVQKWIEQEKQGVQFPVDFEDAWRIAGYSKKANAKKKLVAVSSDLEKGVDYCSNWSNRPTEGGSEELITLTTDCFKHFCLMARTEKGKLVRKYFIAAEKELNIIKENHPAIAVEAEQKRIDQEERILDKQLRLKELEGQNFDKINLLATLHGQEFTLILLGKENAIARVEKPVTEVLEPKTGDTSKIMTAPQVQKYIQSKTGIRIKSLSEFNRAIQSAGRDDLLVPVTRHNTQLYPIPEKIDEAIALVFGSQQNRQMLLGE
ncbi:MAG: hypothetical protein ACRCYP_04480 [Alphaproteobacteria bacterium]